MRQTVVWFTSPPKIIPISLRIQKAKAKTAVTFKKVSADKPLSISKAGKVTVKKGTKKGTYKIKVKATAKATSAYNSASATKIIKVKVK